MRGATWMGNEDCYAKAFQSTLPVRGATGRFDSDDKGSQHFNPRSPCGERPISPKSSTAIMTHFNPRSPCGERLSFSCSSSNASSFQSTLPVRGATSFFSSLAPQLMYFNPRSPCGERRYRVVVKILRRRKFQSTLPVRGATQIADGVSVVEIISIHAPRAGSDRKSKYIYTAFSLFQSTLPVRGATFEFT